jgi:hypothetical protein
MKYPVIKSITFVSLVCTFAISRDRASKEERGGISYTHLIWFPLPSCIEVSQDQLHDLGADCRVKVSLLSSNKHFMSLTLRPRLVGGHVFTFCLDVLA